MTFAEIKKIKKELKWYPKITITKGINILLESLDYWKKAPFCTPKQITKETKSWFKYLK